MRILIKALLLVMIFALQAPLSAQNDYVNQGFRDDSSTRERRGSYKPDHVIKWNMFGILGGQYQLAFEQSISPKLTAQVSVGSINVNYGRWLFNPDFEIAGRGFIVIPEVRHYMDPEVAGGYVGGRVRYKSVLTEANFLDDVGDRQFAKFRRTVLGIGPIAGYQYVLSNQWTLDFSGGFDLKVYNLDIIEGQDQYDLELGKLRFFRTAAFIGMHFGFNLGYSF